ncbi:vacuolar protein sorting protein [Salix suchowensis]|nr:vacuolar protein sorting protein [Salix suchowensis]
MGLWENSVDLALEKGDLELAQINADMPEDDQPLRKKLWLKIARYVVQDKKDIKTAMRFLESTDLLKIEDILPFFPDFVVIDDFKEEIAHALEGYSAHIETLKGEMDEATRTAEAIKQDIAALRNRFITIEASDAKEYLPSHALRRILTLQNELIKVSQLGGTGAPARQPTTQRTLLSANFATTLVTHPLQNANSLGRNILSAGDKLRDLIIPDALASLVSAPGWIPVMGGGGDRRNGQETDEGKKEKLRKELDDLLASSCPLCESVVAGLDKPFVKEGEVDESWAL